MRIVATRILARDLQPGDLFSAAGQKYWDLALDPAPIGERVYIRTTAPAGSAPDADTYVYKITIER